jgi:hypothetical protein
MIGSFWTRFSMEYQSLPKYYNAGLTSFMKKKLECHWLLIETSSSTQLIRSHESAATAVYLSDAIC